MESERISSGHLKKACGAYQSKIGKISSTLKISQKQLMGEMNEPHVKDGEKLSIKQKKILFKKKNDLE